MSDDGLSSLAFIQDPNSNPTNNNPNPNSNPSAKRKRNLPGKPGKLAIFTIYIYIYIKTKL